MHRVAENRFHEFQARLAGYSLIAGIDEAGRGPLAGPVVAAAVILSPEIELEGVKDSKKMSEKAREKAFSLIQSQATAFSIAVIDHEEIDRINILEATRKAMKCAASMLHPQPDHLLIDGNCPVDTPIPQTCIIRGDALSLSIAAASVLAKVYRDRIMCSYHALFPQYGFSLNKGYGTEEHRKALMKYGPCRIHRLSFKGVLI